MSLFLKNISLGVITKAISDCSKMADTERTGPKLRSEDATEYLEKHRVLELFNNLTSQLIYSRPGY